MLQAVCPCCRAFREVEAKCPIQFSLISFSLEYRNALSIASSTVAAQENVHLVLPQAEQVTIILPFHFEIDGVNSFYTVWNY